MRRRIETALHRVIDISKLSDASAAAAIRENQIDILVNLNGYFGKQRRACLQSGPPPFRSIISAFPVR
jgi:predicted O-linked N-acetylglucosamine transferase (SPINDLY family)